MSNEIDEKVIEMRFENQQFEEGVRTSLITLEKLKNALKLDGVTDGLFKVGDAVKNCDTTALASGVDEVKTRFSALEIASITALANITNNAVNAGRRILSALTMDPVKTGLSEYETKINAIQVIKANTMGKNTMEEITAALDELNTYADKTIYNFTQMTSNVGKFVAQGLDVKQATNAIQGMANLAAASGASAADMSRATYQMSQALGGIIRKIDWNSLRNANMATTTLKETIMDIAKIKDIDIDAMIKKKGTFEETLEEGWLTGELFTEAMNIYSGVYSEAELKEKGFNEEQVKHFQEIAKMAEEAATEVKTLSQLWDVLKETAQSGWTQSWEWIIGDFDTAKRDLTKAQVYLSDMINESSQVRNDLLEAWSKGGGRDALINSLVNTFKAGLTVVTTIKDGFRDIIPPMTAERLIQFSQKLEQITKSLALTDKETKMFKDTVKGLASVLDIIIDVAQAAFSFVTGFLGSGGLRAILDIILSITSAVGRLATELHEGLKLDTLSSAISSIGNALSSMFKAFTSKDAMLNSLGTIGSWLVEAANAIVNAFAKAISFIGENISIGDLFSAVISTGIYAELRLIFDSIDGFSEKIASALRKVKDDILGLKETARDFKEIMKIFREALNALVLDINARTLLKVAGAILMLTISMNYLSKLDLEGLAKGIVGVAAAAAILIKSWLSILNILTGIKAFFKGVGTSSIAILALAVSVSILASSIKKLGEIDIWSLAKGTLAASIAIRALAKSAGMLGGKKTNFAAVAAILALAEAVKIVSKAIVTFGKMKEDQLLNGFGIFLGVLALMSTTIALLSKLGRKNKVSLKTSIAFLAMAESMKIAAEAVKTLSDISDPQAVVGVSAFTGILLELSLAAALLGKFGKFRSIEGAAAVLIMAKAMSEVAEAFSVFAEFNDTEVENGLIGFCGTLGAMSTVIAALGKIAGMKSIVAGAALVIGSESLENISDFLEQTATRSWEQIQNGLAAMGMALLELGTVETAMGYFGNIASLLGAGAIWIGAQSLSEISAFLLDLGTLTWEQIQNGLAAMGMALLELGTVETAMGYFGNIASLLGATAILEGVLGLGKIADFMLKIGSMTWGEIGRGLVAMGGALLEIGAIETALGYFGELAAILGGVAIMEVVVGLGEIADAFKKFGEMQWDEIGRGLAAMGGALTEIALGGLANTLSFLGSFSITKIAEPLGALADSVKKWADVSIPESIGGQLTKLAFGVGQFTLSGWGADAVATVAKPLGDLADSVKKWKDVTIPDKLGKTLRTLSHAVNKFFFGDIGAGALKSGAEGLGSMADAMKKWKDVAIPVSLNTKISGLSDAVKSWTWAFAGNATLNGAAGPLGQLADTMKKWKDVEIPENLSANLKTLGEALSSFNFDFLAGWSLDGLAKPLVEFANSVKTLAGVKFPEDLGTKLTSFEKDIRSFAAKVATISLNRTDELNSFANAIKTLTDTMNSLAPVNADVVESFVSGVEKLSSMKISSSNLESSAAAVSSAVDTLMEDIQGKISGESSTMEYSMAVAMSGLGSAIYSKQAFLNETISNIIDGMGKKVEGKSDSLNTAFKKALATAPSAVKGKYSDFYKAGEYIADGVSAGITSKSGSVYDIAYDLGQTVARAVKTGAQINSPSKITRQAGVGMVEGVIYGIGDLRKEAIKEATGFGNNTANAMSEALSAVADIFGIGFDTTPTITPVVDLSMVNAGASKISDILNVGHTIGFDTNITAINRNIANRQNGNADVVGAINRLNKKLDHVGGTTNYTTIDGVHYNEGTEVADAVAAIVRAARIERRV